MKCKNYLEILFLREKTCFHKNLYLCTENLNLTNDKLALVEGDLERTKRQVDVKESEITRLTNDLKAGRERLKKEIERVKRLQQLLKDRENTSFEGEDRLFKFELEVKYIYLY